MLPKHFTIAAALPLLAVLGSELSPFIRAIGVSKNLTQYMDLVGYVGSPVSVVTVVGMLIAIRWAKTVVATMSAMFSVAVGVDMVRYGVDFSKSYATEDIFLTACFGLSAALLIVAVLAERRQPKGNLMQQRVQAQTGQRE